MTDDEDMMPVRAAFERDWPNWTRCPNGGYADQDIDFAWRGFQDGWNARAQVAAPVVSVELCERCNCAINEKSGC